MDKHFGKWVMRVREQAGATQQMFALALGLKSYAAIRLIEKKKDDTLRGSTREALMYIVGVTTAQDLGRMWRAGELPDPGQVIERLSKRLAIAVTADQALRRPQRTVRISLSAYRTLLLIAKDAGHTDLTSYFERMAEQATAGLRIIRPIPPEAQPEAPHGEAPKHLTGAGRD